MVVDMMVEDTTAPVPRLQVEILLHLLGKIIIVNLVSLVHIETALLLKTHCGTVMDVIQTTHTATRLGCHGSTGTSHRKWVMTLRCACVLIRTLAMKKPT